MGDYDLNDLVHNYSYQEGINQSATVTEITFDYKFPAMGANFNNSFVLRVIDEDNNATLSLDSSSVYASSEITRLYDEHYPALNLPTMYNDSSNFLNCGDSSSGNDLFVNSNKFPWVLNDLPMDLPWSKEGISILEGYPNFDDFVMSNPGLDWYSDKNGNRKKEKLNN